MPITKTAKKSLKRSEKLRDRNLVFKVAMKESIKKIKKAVEKNETDNMTDLLKNAYSAIDKAAKRNIIHKNNASRKKSRLVKLVKKIIAA